MVYTKDMFQVSSSHFVSFERVCRVYNFFCVCVLSLLVLDIAFTFNVHRALAYPSDHFCSLSLSLSLSTFPILFSSFSHSLARQSKRCLFALHYLYIYISAHKYRL